MNKSKRKAVVNYDNDYQGNPYMPLWEYVPDGEPYVFEDPDNPGKYRLYVYGSHDMRKTGYCGTDQVVWSAPVEDLSDWRKDGVIFESIVGGKGDVLYAPDIVLVERDGKKEYYLYPNNQTSGRLSMVAKSDRPDGPFVPINFKQGSTTQTDGPIEFDPAVMVDDDGKVYAYWGYRDYSKWCLLDEDNMSTLKEGTEIHNNIPGYDVMMADDYNPEDFNIYQDENVKKWGFFEASSIRKVGNKYVFIYSRNGLNEEPTGKNCAQLAYGYSDSPAGPWKYGGIIVDAAGEIIPKETGGYSRTFKATNTHGSICEINGQWYIFYHRSLQKFARQAMVDPVSVEWDDRPVSEGGEVRISMAEVTSNGFYINGLNPYKKHSAGIASYLTGNAAIEPAYEETTTTLPVTGIKNGVIAGIKYFNFDLEAPSEGDRSLEVELKPLGVDATVDVYIRPTTAVNTPVEYDSSGAITSVGVGSKKIGTITLTSGMPQQLTTFSINADVIEELNGQWGVFFVFNTNQSEDICEFYNMQFK